MLCSPKISEGGSEATLYPGGFSEKRLKGGLWKKSFPKNAKLSKVRENLWVVEAKESTAFFFPQPVNFSEKTGYALSLEKGVLSVAWQPSERTLTMVTSSAEKNAEKMFLPTTSVEKKPFFLHPVERITDPLRLWDYCDSGVFYMPLGFRKKTGVSRVLKIYHLLKGKNKKISGPYPNHSVAEGVYNIASLLWHATRKKIYWALMLKAGEFCEKSLQPDGKYVHGEHGSEDQYRFHVAAINVLVNLYDETKKASLIQAASRAAEHLVKHRLGAWFPHDSLEYAARKNKRVLNTHLASLCALMLVYSRTKKKSLFSAAEAGWEEFLRLVEKERPAGDSWLEYFLTTGAKSRLFYPLGFLAMLRLGKSSSFSTRRGFLKRDYAGGFSTHYHFLNVWDLLTLEGYFDVSRLRGFLHKAIVFGHLLCKRGFARPYVHSDWYFANALQLACRLDESYVEMLPVALRIQEELCGFDPRLFGFCEPSNPVGISAKKFFDPSSLVYVYLGRRGPRHRVALVNTSFSKKSVSFDGKKFAVPADSALVVELY